MPAMGSRTGAGSRSTDLQLRPLPPPSKRLPAAELPLASAVGDPAFALLQRMASMTCTFVCAWMYVCI